MVDRIDYEKLRKREEYYLTQAKTALKMLNKRCSSSTGLALPTSQVNEAADKFSKRIIDLTDRAWAVGYDLGIKDAQAQMKDEGINLQYVKSPETMRPPDEDLFAQRDKFEKTLADAKYLLQVQPGEKENLLYLQRVTLATISVWANESYTRAYLRAFSEFAQWLNASLKVANATI